MSQTSCTGVEGINYIYNVNAIFIESLVHLDTFNFRNNIWAIEVNGNLTINSFTLNNVKSYFGAVLEIYFLTNLIFNNFTGINLQSNFQSSIAVTSISNIQISNFECNSCVTANGNGGGMVVIPSAMPSVIVIENFLCNGCSAYNGFGGAIYFHSYSTTLLHNVNITNFVATNCQAGDGAGIYISAYFSFNVGKFSNITISYSSTVQGAGFTDNH